MFESPDSTRWSDAKYALEVFAALLEPKDTLNVFRMSDFKSGATGVPARLRLSGSTAPEQNVTQIAKMPMLGGGTPYAPVKAAMSDADAGAAEARWVVVLTDGAFDGQTQPAVQDDLKSWVGGGSDRHVAMMTIGDAAPTYSTNLGSAITTAHVSSADVLSKMTGFANVVFGRSTLRQNGAGRVDTNGVGLDEAIVFTQGAGANIGHATAGSTSSAPKSTTDVTWVKNPVPANETKATPNRGLVGQLATFDDLPGGTINFGVSGAARSSVTVFYKPRARFDVHLTDSTGHTVDKNKAMAGTYTVRYGFVDDRCHIVNSPLFGSVSYDATILAGGKKLAAHFKSGERVALPRGEVTVEASAKYLGTATASQNVSFTMLEPARPATVTATAAPTYRASKMNGYRAPEDAIALDYRTVDGPFTAAEWTSIRPGSFHVNSSRNIRFTVSLGSRPGQVYLTPHAPNGDVYQADTGRIPFTLTGSHVYDGQLNTVKYSSATAVDDDLPWSQRAAHWLATTGWKIALGLLALLLLCGYVFKRRFSKKIKRSPRIVGTPNSMGRASEEARGKFTVTPGRKLLPFVPDTATLRFTPPGVAGFRTMKLKAGPSKTMLLENFRQLAEKANVEVNGMAINAESRRPPRLSPSTPITARTPVMTYDMTPKE